MSDTSGASSVISLPKGGGAQAGLGEKFSPDLHTGTGNFSVPIALPPGRNGFQPQLNLSYSTGNGNGPLGLGWNFSIPGVTRKTSKGIPIYDDSLTSLMNHDTFILSGSEDLVALERSTAGDITYRPRTEGLFAKIVRHRNETNDFWEVHSTDGLMSRYGTESSKGSDPSVIADPAVFEQANIFAWKLTRTVDPFGNTIVYEYERDTGIDGSHHWDQVYLRQIRYVDYELNGEPGFLVWVTFNYEERPDPFSEYRSGFEIRTHKRCTSIAISTHADQERLVRTYDLIYLDSHSDLSPKFPLNGTSLLSQIIVTGYAGEATEAMPPLEFSYSDFDPTAQTASPLQGPNLPSTSLHDPNLDLVDLFGQGLPDILEMRTTAVRYWRNLGNGEFDSPQFMATAPAGLALAQAGVQLLDANGNGRLDLLVTKPGLSGYFPLRFGGLWDNLSFRPYRLAPTFDLKGQQVKLLDLDGDGVTDALHSSLALECYFSDSVNGWSPPRAVVWKPGFPKDFSDPRVKWADMSGDGLQDAVLIENGSVTYWPNLGYGRWGDALSMGDSLDLPFQYDPKRVLLGDIDGDGLADIVYVENGQITLWINQSGNGWSDPIVIDETPTVTDSVAVRLVDIHGSGAVGVLWSQDLTGTGANFYFWDATAGIKPYLLNEMDNHIGAVTKIQYAPSTQFYLEDQGDPATRWKTVLPFPVQVVSRVEVIDELSKGKMTTQYRYHDGYWDGVDREFRGFGMVEQYDSESFARYNSSGLHGEEATFANIDPQHFSAPTLTRTWFHQGPIGDDEGIEDESDRAMEYWAGDSPKLDHAPHLNTFLTPFTTRIKRDALRTLRGSVLRTELYAQDGSAREARPYTVTESRYELVEVDAPSAADSERLRIFCPHKTATRTTQWERGEDPLTQCSITGYTNELGEFDPFGRPLTQMQIACPRGWRNLDDGPAESYLCTGSRTMYAKPLGGNDYIHTRVAAASTYEILHTDGKQLHQVAALINSAVDLKLIAHSLSYYDGEAFVGLPLGQVGQFGALTRTETLALSDELLVEAYGTEIPPYLEPSGIPVWPDDEYPLEFRTLLPTRAGYAYHAGSAEPTDPAGYFINGERRGYDFQLNSTSEGRGLVLEQRDSLYDAIQSPSGHRTTISYDDYQFLPQAVTDAAGLTSTATHDYRVLYPSEITDPNGNRSSVSFSPLGLVTSSFIRGKSTAEGDWMRPSARMEYDFFAFENSPPGNRQPIFVRTTRHIHHDTELDVLLPERDETIITVEYSDGFGRLLQTRTQGEDVRFGDQHFGGGEDLLPLKQSDGPGGDVIGRENTDGLLPNVIVSGWQIYSNKGQIVEKYEPFFSEGWDYDQPSDSKTGQQVTMIYDPRGYAIRTINPDKSEQLVIYGVPGTIAVPDLSNPESFEPTPWEVFTYDPNDNAGRTHPAESDSYQHQWDTPSSVLIDALGRIVETVARNRNPPLNPGDLLPPIEAVRTRTCYDIRGNVLTITDALGRKAFHDHVYDYTNRKMRAESIDAGLRFSVVNAAGGVIEQRDGKGAHTLHGYDGLNRPFRLWSRDGKNQKLSLREQLEYGDAGSPAQSAADRASNQAANRLGKQFRQWDEAGVVKIEGYDFKGNLLEKTRQVVSDQALLKTFNGPPQDWKVEAFRVDWATTAGVILDPNTYATTMSYDALNRIKVLTYPEDVEHARRQLKPHYNRAGALERMSLDGDTFVKRIVYDAKGQRVLIAYGNGIMTRYAYDPHTFQLRNLRTERFSQPEALVCRHAGGPLQLLAYDYDLAGNILAISDRTPESGIKDTLLGLDALDRKFTYDAMSRLLTATGRECDCPSDDPWDDTLRGTDPTKTRSYTEHYLYDLAGNIKQLIHLANGGDFTRTFDLVAGNNRLGKLNIGVIGFDYHYDANGNMTGETTSRHFEWDYADRMRVYRTQTNASEPSVHAHYLYDAGGQRVKKLVRKQGGQIEVTVYIDGAFEYQRIVHAGLVEENNTLHVMDDQNRIALVRVGNPFTNDTTPAVKYCLADHLGSSNVVINGLADEVNREEFTPYGETSFGSFARKRFRFTGKEKDEESGLNYHGARYYAPWLGRWTSCDPAGIVDGLCLYRYAQCNPLLLVDQSGTQSSDNIGDAGVPAGAPPQTITEPAASIDDSSVSNVITIPEVTIIGQPIERSTVDVPTQFNSSETLEYEPAGAKIDLTPGGIGEPDYISPPGDEGTGPLIDGIISGSQNALIDQVDNATDVPNVPDLGKHEILENQKSVAPDVANGSGGLGWFIGYAATNAIIIFAMARIFIALGRRSIAKPAVEGDPWSPAEVTKRQGTVVKANGPLAAKALGYEKRIPPQKAPFDSHGQDVFSNGKTYITADMGSHTEAGSHIGGVWKKFDARGNRLGTYDANLNRIGD